jgi:ketosteroid isomerase-like protein
VKRSLLLVSTLLIVLCPVLAGCTWASGASHLGREIKERLRPSDSSEEALASDKTAIQLVIQRGNFEQELALTLDDPTIMKESSTASHYQEMESTHRGLKDGRVVGVRLVDLQWGPITVDGQTATAATLEMWSVTLADGKTRQSQDRNVYTLVREGGRWKIQSNAHPDSAAAAKPSPTGAGGERVVGPRVAPTLTPGVEPAPTPARRSSSSQAERDEDAVKRVIAAANEAQERAIATRDPSPMRETTTASHYREMAGTNQELLASGAVSVKLLDVEWGAVAVDGRTATVVAYETWEVRFADGRVHRSTDRNLYTLSQRGDTWRIQRAEHPDDDRGVPRGMPQV